MLGYDILKVVYIIWLVILTQIIHDVRRIEKAQVELATS